MEDSVTDCSDLVEGLYASVFGIHEHLEDELYCLFVGRRGETGLVYRLAC